MKEKVMGERLEERRKDTINTCYTHIWTHHGEVR